MPAVNPQPIQTHAQANPVERAHSGTVAILRDASRDARGAPDTARVPHLAVINGLRGCAILAVIYHHLFHLFLTPLGGRAVEVGPLSVSKHSLFSNGWLGVNLFFILSGFVLMLPYALVQRSMSEPGSVRHYYARRAARLLPLYYFALTASVFFLGRQDFLSSMFLRDLVRMVTFSFVFNPVTFFPKFNPVLWSLAVEVWFSLLFPLLVLLWRRIGALPVTIAALAFCLAVRIHATGMSGGVLLHYVKDGIGGRLDDFVIGMLLAHVFVRYRLQSRGLSLGAIGAGFVLLNLSAVLWDNVQLRLLDPVYGAGLNNLTQLAFGLIILGLLGAPLTGLRRLFTSTPLQLAGAMSYSLYIWHTIGTFGKERSAPVYDLPVYLLFAVLLSAATYRYIEFRQKSARELFFGFRSAAT